MIYIDSEYKCHTSNLDGTFREVELNTVEREIFEGKCQTFIEGYCYDDRKGYKQIYPWKPYDELAAAQVQYEADLAEAAAAYQEGVNSAYDQ